MIRRSRPHPSGGFDSDAQSDTPELRKHIVMLTPLRNGMRYSGLASSFITDGRWYKAVLHVLVWLGACACQWLCWNEMRQTDAVTPEELSLALASALLTSLAIPVIVVFGSVFTSLPQWPVVNALLFAFAAVPLGFLVVELTVAARLRGILWSLSLAAFALQVLGISMIFAFYIAMITRFDGSNDPRAASNKDWGYRMRPEPLYEPLATEEV